jgi:hypothetical protein
MMVRVIVVREIKFLPGTGADKKSKAMAAHQLKSSLTLVRAGVLSHSSTGSPNADVEL